MSAAVQVELKGLEGRLAAATARLADATARRREAEQEVREQQNKVAELRRRIDQLKLRQRGLIVSEHAMIRYLERVAGLDLEQLKRDIVGGRDPATIDATGIILMPIPGDRGGHKLRIKDNTVVTVVTEDDQGN